MLQKENRNQPEADKIKNIFEKSLSFVITGHINPDGDTIGCELALYSWLISAGKTVEIVNADPVPEYLTFLNNWEVIRTTLPSAANYDVAVILECPEISRSGGILSKANVKNIINIDHHVGGAKTHSDIPQVNYVNPGASSCAELVYGLMKYCGHAPTRDEADALFTGIITDTNRFQQANTTPESLIAASELLKSGVSTVEIARKIYNTRRFQALKLLGFALATLKQENSVAYMKITREISKKAAASQEDVEEIVNYAGMLPGVEIYALFRELGGEKNITKVSLRSHQNANVNAIASKYGGGGHFHAAGFKFEGTADETILNVLPVLKTASEKNG